MQLMAEVGTEDGETKGLGLVPSRIDRFTNEELDGRKVPHVGFNSIMIHAKEGFFSGLEDISDFYFTHSYRMLPFEIGCSMATCNYGINFLAAFHMNNLFGAQFHPEKSQTNGLILLKNFLEHTPC
jgi:glutamine amidotransferase